MVGTHDVFFGSEKIGQVTVERRGLYYRFYCRCRLSGAVVCKLVAEIGGQRENLGVLVPDDSDFVLDSTHPVKRFAAGMPHFAVKPKHTVVAGEFIPLSPEEPFRYLCRLETAYMEVRNGCAGIVLSGIEA